MGPKLIGAGTALLSALVLAGTALYVQGCAPPFPANMWAFNALAAVCVGFALRYGRR